ncbi:MAG TPA: hypothetical protein VLJ86_10405, partial [Ramlibacter sp.]|nr:hypothetical protein [Ramlibacter sp.]
MGALVGVGLALVGAIVATWLLESFVQAKAPLAMFLLSTILIAAWLGWRYAVFTAVAGVALSRWLFVDAAQVSAHYPRLA